MVPLYILTALLSVSIFAGLALTIKYLLPISGGPIQFLIVQLFIGWVILSILLINELVKRTTGIQNFDKLTVIYILLATCFSFIGFITYIVGLDRGNASVGGVVLSSRVFFSIPLAIVFVGEIYQFQVYVFIFIAFIGAVLVSWQENLSFIQLMTFKAKGVRWFLLTALTWSIANLFVRKLNNEVPLITFLFLRQLISLIAGLALFYTIKNRLNLTSIVLTKKFLIGTLIYVLLNLVAQAAFIFSLGVSLSITESIGVFEGTLTFTFSILFAWLISNDVLEEPLNKISLSIRAFGVLLSIIGTFGVINFS